MALEADTGAEISGVPGTQAPATRWNFTVLGADIAFFSLGLSISSVYTVLPLFVHHLTTNNEAVALIPAIRALGLYGPQLLVASVAERRRRVMPYILTLTVLERVPYLLLAIAAILLSQQHPQLLLVLFMGMIFLALLGSGLTYPAWLDMIARAIPSNWIGRFFGFWSGVGGLLGIGGAAIAAAILAQVSWPLNFALCFSLTFGAFVISFVLLALGREPPRLVKGELQASQDRSADIAVVSVPSGGMWQQLREVWQLLRADGDLRRLIASNGLVGISTMASALFAVAALRRGGLTDAEVGIESAVLFIAMAAGTFLWGAVGDHFGHRTILVWGSASIALSALLALWARGFWPYALVFLLLGLNVAAVNLAASTLITEFGPEERRPTYVALASVGYAPFVIGAPPATFR